MTQPIARGSALPPVRRVGSDSRPAVGRYARGAASDERGFSIVETTVALGVILTVLLGMLASLDGAIRGVLTGRQRSGGAAVAKAVLEQARAVDWDTVGHDLNEATLVTDPEVGGQAPNWSYTPEGGTAEKLAGAAAALYPVHQWDLTRDATTYTVKVYVTEAPVTNGDPLKRLTVVVSWNHAQFDTSAVENVIRVSTFLSEFAPPATLAVTSGLVDVDGGGVSVTGDLSGIDLSEAHLYLPYAHAEVEGHLVDATRGYAGSARGSIDLGSGTPTGCTVEGSRAECAGTKAETLADNDGGTAPPLQDASGPLSSSSVALAAGRPSPPTWGPPPVSNPGVRPSRAWPASPRLATATGFLTPGTGPREPRVCPWGSRQAP